MTTEATDTRQLVLCRVRMACQPLHQYRGVTTFHEETVMLKAARSADILDELDAAMTEACRRPCFAPPGKRVSAWVLTTYLTESGLAEF